jgi:hypothetical protein
MSDATAESIMSRQELATLDRTIAETHKLVAETGKLLAERDKFRRDRSVAMLLGIGAAGGAVATAAGLVLKALGWIT